MKISELIQKESHNLAEDIINHENYKSGIFFLTDRIEEAITQIFNQLPDGSFFGCQYAWSGEIPCTGVYRCLYCGKIADATPTDYSKVDRDRFCLGKSMKGPKWQG